MVKEVVAGTVPVVVRTDVATILVLLLVVEEGPADSVPQLAPGGQLVMVILLVIVVVLVLQIPRDDVVDNTMVLAGGVADVLPRPGSMLTIDDPVEVPL